MHPSVAMKCAVVLAALLLESSSVHLPGQMDGRGGAPNQHVCVEAYLDRDGDYGAAANRAIQAQPAKTPSVVAICKQGEHPVSSTIIADRPVLLDFSGSTLIPQHSLESEVFTTGATTITSGIKTIRLSGGNDLHEGMAVSGVGLKAGTTITRIRGQEVSLSLAPVLQVVGMPATQRTIVGGLNSMVGLVEGQGVSGVGITSGTKITRLFPEMRAMELSAPVSVAKIKTYRGPADSAIVMSVGSSWQSALYAVVTKPVIRWQYNATALHNQEGQMVGGAMRGVHIQDPGDRSLIGIQGAQIYGWDRLKVDDFEVDNLRGSGLILGGVNTFSTGTSPVNSVRESQFTNIELRDCGDPATGQSSLEIMTPETNGDRINQIKFVGLQVVFPYAEGVTIGSYAAPEEQGPGLLWFMGNSQIEGGSHVTNQNINAPFDLVGIQSGYDIHFSGMSILSTGYGKAAIRIDAAYLVNVMDCVLTGFQKGVIYRVAVEHDNNTVRLSSDPNHPTFAAEAVLQGGGGILRDSGSCSSGCPVWVKSKPSDDQLILYSTYKGREKYATLEISGGGYDIINTGSTWQKATILGNAYGDMDSSHLALLGLTNTGQMFLAGALPEQSYFFDSPSLGVLTLGGSMYLEAIHLGAVQSDSLSVRSLITNSLQIGRSTPSSSHESCNPGQVWFDAKYIYACVAAGTIRRSELKEF